MTMTPLDGNRRKADITDVRRMMGEGRNISVTGGGGEVMGWIDCGV